MTQSLLADPPADVMGHLFPWVEAELTALEVCVVQSHCNQDIALQQFLKLLQWLHLVLVQDCALLHSKYPQCPIFHFAPFTFPSFTAFSANASSPCCCSRGEGPTFHTLPDHVAWSMHGYAADLQMKQELNHSKLWDELQKLQEENVHLVQLLGASKGSKYKTPGEFLDP
jgi:hypothetical protein